MVHLESPVSKFNSHGLDASSIGANVFRVLVHINLSSRDSHSNKFIIPAEPSKLVTAYITGLGAQLINQSNKELNVNLCRLA